MARIEAWHNLPAGVRQHLIERMHDRAITIADLNQLRLRIESQPEVPEDDWYKDFGSFKICGSGSIPNTFLLRGQLPRAKHCEAPDEGQQPQTTFSPPPAL